MSTIQLNSRDFASQTSSAEPVLASTVTGGAGLSGMTSLGGASAYVGVNDASPSYMFTVQENRAANWIAKFTNDASDGAGVMIEGGGGAGDKVLKCIGGTTEGFRVLGSGDVWVYGQMSAGAVLDRTPYPESIEQAWDVVNSHEKLPDGEYDPNDKENQLDHSKLDSYVGVQDVEGNNVRDMSAVLSCSISALKDVSARLIELETANVALEARVLALESV
jgi:hypothetical protein